ncbi:MAG: photosystem II biogenesis protein Psp29 [Kamptonema sp. SIO4C4]|nr:photosystem II biogenesis protein Psp29 [Kamptonema sp. SIO4C4]
MDNVRTVSDTKRNFYTHHTRPINSIYRRVVEELMVEMHLLSVNVNFNYDPVYALGVVTSFDRFMLGYRPEKDQESIFNALCQSVEGDPGQYRHDAEQLKGLAERLSVEQLVSWNTALGAVDGGQMLYDCFKAIAFNPNFKYSRLFAIGLYTLIEGADPEIVNNEEQRNSTLQTIGDSLKLPVEKMKQDLELYKENLEKLEQAKSVLEDVLSSDRKQRQQRLLDKQPQEQEEEQPSDSAGEEKDSAGS